LLHYYPSDHPERESERKIKSFRFFDEYKPINSLDKNKVMEVENYVENAIQLQLGHVDLRMDDD
jgi:hypothetical protein